MSEARKSRVLPAVLIGGGAAVLTGLGTWWFIRKNNAAVAAVKQAVATGGSFLVHTTGYWPYQEGLTAKERLMEGIPFDRKAPSICKTNPNDPSCKSHEIHTLEMHLRDPVAHPFVSVSGDDQVFPYGQRIGLSAWPNAVFRVVDTGGHFRGVNKVYRVMGQEPLDIAVDSSKTFVPKTAVTAYIFTGDNFEHGKAVATSGIRNQTVAGEVIDAVTSDDREALARMIESELGGRPREEQVAAAWAVRNRAEVLELSVHDLLAPQGTYGSSAKSDGYASTRRAPTDVSRSVAAEVLDASRDVDPTDGAIDYWVPAQQGEMNKLGDVHRAALSSGDSNKAKKYERYARYGTEEDVREQHRRSGVSATTVVGSVELLKRVL